MVEFDELLFSRWEFYKSLKFTKKHGYMWSTGAKIRPIRDAIFIWDGELIHMHGVSIVDGIGIISIYGGC